MTSNCAAVSEHGSCKTLFYSPENMSTGCSTDIIPQENAIGHFESFKHPSGVKGMDQQEKVSASFLTSFFC
jgi:hypothetical protein